MTSSLSKALVSTTISNVIVMFLNICSGVLIARLLAPTGRGELASLTTWLQNLSWICSCGLSQAITYQMARAKQCDEVIGLAVGGTLVTGALGWLVATLVLPRIFEHQSQGLSLIALYLSASIPLTMLTESVKALVAGMGDFEFLSRINVLQILIYVGSLGVLKLAGGFTVFGVALCLNIPSVIAISSCGLRLRKSVSVRMPSASLVRECTIYGLRQQVANVGAIASKGLDMMLMPTMLVASQIGLYSVSATISTALVQLLSSVSLVIFPLATRANGSADMTACGIRIVLLAGTAIALVIGFAGPQLVGLVYGPAFAGTVATLRILLPGSVLLAASGVAASGLQANNLPHLGGVGQMSGLLITVVGLWLFLRSYGINAAAVVSTVAYTATFVSMLVLLRQKCGLSLRSSFAPSAFSHDVSRIAARAMTAARLSGSLNRTKPATVDP